MLGFRRGLYFTILLGYCLIPLMVLIGLMFKLGRVYYCILAILVAFESIHLLQNRGTLLGDETEAMFELGPVLARDFVIMAIVHTTNLMLNSYLKGALAA